jgi:hypothetical protein
MQGLAELELKRSELSLEAVEMAMSCRYGHPARYHRMRRMMVNNSVAHRFLCLEKSIPWMAQPTPRLRPNSTSSRETQAPLGFLAISRRLW